MKYISYEGLAYLWGKLKATFAPIQHTHKLYDTTGEDTDGAMTQKATTEALDDIQIGATNLLIGTKENNASSVAFQALQTGRIEFSEDEGYGVIQLNGSGSAYMGVFYATGIRAFADRDGDATVNLPPGEYVLSFMRKANTRYYPSVQFRLFEKKENGAYTSTIMTYAPRMLSISAFSDSEQWERVVVKLSIDDAFAFSNIGDLAENKDYILAVGFVPQASFLTGAYIQIKKLKLEMGNKPTAWSPAPEDIEARVAAIEARLASLGM